MSKRHFITEDCAVIRTDDNIIKCLKCVRQYKVSGMIRKDGEGWREITSKDITLKCSCSGYQGVEFLLPQNGYIDVDNVSIYQVVVPKKTEADYLTYDFTKSGDSIKDFWSEVSEPELDELPTDRENFRSFISGYKNGRTFPSKLQF